MGMFTTILDPDKNLSVQIKYGWDTCDTFSVGDTVPWHILKDWPNQGYLFDDVYLGIGGTPEQGADRSWDDYWVVIKNHIVQKVFILQDGDDYSELRDRFKIQDPPADLWSEEVWEEYRQEQAQARKESNEFAASIAHLSAVERCALTLHRAFGRRRSYADIAKDLFIVEPLPQRALPIYDYDPDATASVDEED